MTEYIDLYTRGNVPLGKTIERDAPRGPHEYFQHAHILLCNAEGKWLVQLRSKKKRYFPGIWDVTGGGVDAGETTKQTACREVEEELGLKIPIEDFRFAGHQIVDEVRGLLDVWCVRLDFQISDCTIQQDEVDEIKFVTFAELADEICAKKGPEFRAILENARTILSENPT